MGGVLDQFLLDGIPLNPLNLELHLIVTNQLSHLETGCTSATPPFLQDDPTDASQIIEARANTCDPDPTEALRGHLPVNSNRTQYLHFPFCKIE